MSDLFDQADRDRLTAAGYVRDDQSKRETWVHPTTGFRLSLHEALACLDREEKEK